MTLLTQGPADDAQVPAFVDALGVPGLADIHVHFLPERVLAKVWAFFDDASHYGRAWPITYRTPAADRVATLRALRVLGFPALTYPHKADMAEWLTGWALDFAAATPGCVPSGTFYPEPSADRYVAEALARGARVWKAHLQVGGYDPRDPLLTPVWRRLAAARVPVVVHCGSGPRPGPFTGPGPMAEVLAAHPDLVCVVAHLGMPEYAGFVELARRFPAVHLDTTMAFTDFSEAAAPFPPELLPALVELGDRVVLGSDFPNIPHPYSHQLAALARLGLGADWLRAVCWHNGARLLDLKV